jgi:hypothetical protein
VIQLDEITDRFHSVSTPTAWSVEARALSSPSVGRIPASTLVFCASMTKKKITVEVDEELLKAAQEYTGTGVTGTVRQGLELIASSDAYDALRRQKGMVRFSIDLKTMREDRS